MAALAAVPPATAPAAAARVVGTSPSQDPSSAQDWALAAARVPEAWKRTKGAEGIVIAVVDTGVAAGQADLDGAVRSGRNVIDGSADTHDDNGHGTFVAGVIAARADNGLGAAGVCPRCSILPVKVIGASGTGGAGAVAAGIRWAVDAGARVVNMSFAMPAPDPGVAAAVAYAHDHGVLLVAGAGNGGETAPTYPAAYPNVLGVAAVDSARELYPWSARGGWVAVSAPGCSISTGTDGGFHDFCGTSSASAFVAGLAGLLLSGDPAATGDQVAHALTSTARTPQAAGVPAIVDASAALDELAPAPPPRPALRTVRRKAAAVRAKKHVPPRKKRPRAKQRCSNVCHTG